MKKWTKIVTSAALALAVAMSLTACSNSSNKAANNAPKTQVIEDIAGRKVEVPTDVKKIGVTPIPWASVVYALDGNSERLVAIHPSAMSVYKKSLIANHDKHYGEIDTKLVNQNFSVNMEGMANAGIQTALMWKYQEKDAEKLEKIGVKPILIYNDTVDSLKKSFLIVGKLLGKEEKAKKLNEYYDNAYAVMNKHADAVKKADKPTVVFLRTKQLRLQGNDNFMHEALELAGTNNPIPQSALDSNNKNISMEDVYKINPDVILLSNFDPFVPDDLYNNKIAGQDWSTVKAVQQHHVYKVPMGLYRWDAPGVETPLMMQWLAVTMQPDIFKDIDIRNESKKFYKEFLGFDVTDADLKLIFADEANKNSVPVNK